MNTYSVIVTGMNTGFRDGVVVLGPYDIVDALHVAEHIDSVYSPLLAHEHGVSARMVKNVTTDPAVEALVGPLPERQYDVTPGWAERG